MWLLVFGFAVDVVRPGGCRGGHETSGPRGPGLAIPFTSMAAGLDASHALGVPLCGWGDVAEDAAVRISKVGQDDVEAEYGAEPGGVRGGHAIGDGGRLVHADLDLL